jgi:hypothetical protein
MRWVGHVALGGEKWNVYRILPKERDHYEDLDVGWKILLNWILEK